MSPPHTALQFDYSSKQLALGKVTRPVVTRGDEILVKVAYSGICGTDLHVIHVSHLRFLSQPELESQTSCHAK
jgi:D-arabinose 1-dehydrogenase-like Zn-dependent alcohol dehydrogenase